jgi:hypothetical protein
MEVEKRERGRKRIFIGIGGCYAEGLGRANGEHEKQHGRK